MSWLKIDDQIATHPKILKAGPAAAWLWICGIAYSSNHFTDGFISDAALAHLGIPVSRLLKQLVSRLLKQELWERVKGGFQVHDYLKHNPSAVERRQGLVDKQKAGRIGGHRSWQTRHKTRDRGQKHSAEAESKRLLKHTSSSLPNPDPIRSDPVQGRPPTADARTEDRTNTAGRGADQRRRDTSDGVPSAPASVPVDPPMATTVEEAQAEYDKDPRAYDRKYGRHRDGH